MSPSSSRATTAVTISAMRSARSPARRSRTSSASSSTTPRPTIRQRSYGASWTSSATRAFPKSGCRRTRAGLAATKGSFVCFLDSDDLWHADFLERHLAAHLNESYAVGFTACNARLIDGQGRLIAGCVYWFGKERASADRDRAFAPIDPARVPRLDLAAKTAHWQKQAPYRLYTKRAVHWVWVSTSSMMFRRSLIDLVFPDDDEAFRLHMDFYVVVMAQMVAGSLLIDDALYSYRLHGRNGAADNPVLGGRLHLSSRNWGNTYAVMLDRMLSALQCDRERCVAVLGERQYRRLVLRMRAARAPWPASWLLVARSWLA